MGVDITDSRIFDCHGFLPKNPEKGSFVSVLGDSVLEISNLPFPSIQNYSSQNSLGRRRKLKSGGIHTRMEISSYVSLRNMFFFFLSPHGACKNTFIGSRKLKYWGKTGYYKTSLLAELLLLQPWLGREESYPHYPLCTQNSSHLSVWQIICIQQVS